MKVLKYDFDRLSDRELADLEEKRVRLADDLARRVAENERDLYLIRREKRKRWFYCTRKVAV